MNSRLTQLLLKCYPAAWRAEYGAELEDLLLRGSIGPAEVLNVLWSAVKERVRRPEVKFCFLLLSASTVLFLGGLIFSGPLWRLLSSPASAVLRDHGIRPAALISANPFEQLEVIWLGIPMLLTALGAYPCVLLFALTSFVRTWKEHARQSARRFAALSAFVFVISIAVGLTEWLRGSPLNGLLHLGLASPHATVNLLVSVQDFFLLLLWSTFCWTALWQIPVFLLFAVHSLRCRSSLRQIML